MQPLNYGAKARPEIKFSYGDIDYIVRCANAGDREDFLAKRLESIKTLPDGSRTFHVPKDLKFSLLNVTVIKENGSPVSIQELRSWEPRVTTDLFEHAKRLSEIDDTPVPSAREKLKDAFEECSPPVTFKAFKEWVDSLPEKEMGWLQAFFKEDLVEEGKE